MQQRKCVHQYLVSKKACHISVFSTGFFRVLHANEMGMATSTDRLEHHSYSPGHIPCTPHALSWKEQSIGVSLANGLQIFFLGAKY